MARDIVETKNINVLMRDISTGNHKAAEYSHEKCYTPHHHKVEITKALVNK